jgi:hypothetical protein
LNPVREVPQRQSAPDADWLFIGASMNSGGLICHVPFADATSTGIRRGNAGSQDVAGVGLLDGLLAGTGGLARGREPHAKYHRFAFVNLSLLQPQHTETEKQGLIGVNHVACTFASLDQLLANYAQLKELGIRPYWCAHHGITVSMYHADPDGNHMEFQTECFDSSEGANAFVAGPAFAENPIGVEFDPDEIVGQHGEGRLSGFLRRQVHQPVSHI